jgi:hypothetical protein
MLDLRRGVSGIALGVFAIGIALSAQAGPAMFNASFIMRAFGNDITSGTTYPYNQEVWSAVPLGRDCQSADPYTVNGAPATRYCGSTTMMQGRPATGSGYLVTGGVTTGGPVGLPSSAFSVVTRGFLPTYYPYLQTHTYADFRNAAGTFFAGSGPAAGLGSVTHSGMGQQSGQWTITEGKNGLGGTLRILGKFGAHSQYVITGKVGTYEGTGSWIMVPPLGRPQYATPMSYTPMGKTTNWYNPITLPLIYVNNLNGNISTTLGRATGTEWTTGAVSVYALPGGFPTILIDSGFDTATGTGTTRVRNIQLVTPVITHWIGPGFQGHNAHIGILTLQITPEPGEVLLVVAGAGLLLLLYRANRRS